MMSTSNSHMPPPNPLLDPQNTNMLSNQMQDLKLGPPLPPTPSKSNPMSTTVTYSGQPRATYPYNNNNPPNNNNNAYLPPMGPPLPDQQGFKSPPNAIQNGVRNGHPPNKSSMPPGPFMPQSSSSPMNHSNLQYQSNSVEQQKAPPAGFVPYTQQLGMTNLSHASGNLPPRPPGIQSQGLHHSPQQHNLNSLSSPRGPPGPSNSSAFYGSPSPNTAFPSSGLSPNAAMLPPAQPNAPPQFNSPNLQSSAPLRPDLSRLQGSAPPSSLGPATLSGPPGRQGVPSGFPMSNMAPLGSPSTGSSSMIPPGSPASIPPPFGSMGPPGVSTSMPPPFGSTGPAGSSAPMPPPFGSMGVPGSSSMPAGPNGSMPHPPGAMPHPPGSMISQGSSTSMPFSPGNQFSGMPSQPGMQYPTSGGPMQAAGAYPHASQQQPGEPFLDNMPSTAHEREQDKQTRGGYFTTDTKGQVPPFVTTNFIVQDRGLCSPRFIRSTVYCLPNNPDVLKQTALPFAISINPFAEVLEGENEPPMCVYRKGGPIRCKRCKAYVCPFMTFMEGGRCFQCAFCKVVTEVPQDYFCFLDGVGERQDKYHRPELCLGSYEYTATKDYCRNDELPNPPAYIFMIEVSNATFRNGLIPLLCENMKNVIQCLQGDEGTDPSKVRVGFVTYNNVLHFYNMKKNLSQPHVMVLSDVHHAFVPLLEGFLVTLSEAETLIDSLMEHIPKLFMNEPSTEIILGPVIQVGLEALKNANCSGKLLVFHSTIPNADAPGKLPHREGQKLLGTDKQKTVLVPQTDFYSKLARDCVAAGCAVDLFLFPSAYVDIASLSPLCLSTGGQMYKYTYFQAQIDGDRFLEDLERNVTTATAFDAVLRIRTSTGISPSCYYGNFFMSNATDIEFSAVDCHKAVTVELSYDDKLPEGETVYVQAALLYTASTGERRIRIHNIAFPTSVSMPDVYKTCELDTIVNFLTKQAIKQLVDSTPQQIRSGLVNRAAKILGCYRKNCANSSAAIQLILPESLKLMPLYINCVLKSDAVFGGSEMSLDDRCFSMLAVNSMDVRSTATYLYPNLIPLHDVDPDGEGIPVAIRCSMQKLSDSGAYLLENGIYMFLWIGQGISSEWLENVLGVQSTHLLDKQKATLPELNNPLSKRIRQIIEELEEDSQWYMRLCLIVQGDKLELVFRHFMVEDRGGDGSPSYVEFLCHLHKEISKNQ